VPLGVEYPCPGSARTGCYPGAGCPLGQRRPALEPLARLGLVLERPGQPGLQTPERQRPESVLRVLGQPVRPEPQVLERLEQRRPESVQPEPLVQLQGLVQLEQLEQLEQP